MRNDCQTGNPVHQPTITSPGSTKMIAESVPAADATVCTMLFSRMDESLTALRIAIEITAAGIDEANVSPTLRPRYTLAAVKTVVMSDPRIKPRIVSSFRCMTDVTVKAARYAAAAAARSGLDCCLCLR